jgi:hypothetical protein
MPTLIAQPTVIEAAGNLPKRIEEYAGRVNSGHQGISVGALEVRAGQAVVARPGEWIRYASPEPGGAEYVAVCLPAFAPATVHRDAS